MPNNPNEPLATVLGTNPIPLIDDEARLAELERECGDPPKMFFAGPAVALSTDELRQALALVRALREVRDWAKSNIGPAGNEAISTIINRHTGGKP